MKNVVIVAPEFPPCNLTAGHRSRLFANYLAEFGFRPTVLTIRPPYYEHSLDPELESLLPADLRVIRTRALPTRPVRLVGDLGIRSFPFHYRTLTRLAKRGEIDLLFLPIPPNYSSLLGPLLKRRHGIPYVIDYIDPWVYPITDEERRSWKARLSHWLARRLEPIALKRVDGISAVAESYFEGALGRHPELSELPTIGIPYGAEPRDHEIVRNGGRPSRLLDEVGLGDRLVIAYTGALLPRAREPLKVLLGGLKAARERSEAVRKLHLLFVGTGPTPNDRASGQVEPIAREAGASSFVTEVAARQPYLEVLSLLHRAHAVLVLGSTEPHYTPSKAFPALCSNRPVLALLHQASTGARLLRQMEGVELVTFGGEVSLEELQPNIAAAFQRLGGLEPGRQLVRDLQALERWTAREGAGRLAGFFEEVLERSSSGRSIARSAHRKRAQQARSHG